MSFTYRSYRFVRRLAILLVGGSITLLGLALVVLPGPAFIVLPVGLAVLGVEFAWARHCLRRVKETVDRGMRRTRR